MATPKGQNTWVLGLSVLALAVIIHMVAYLGMDGLVGGLITGLMAAVGYVVLALAVTAVVVALTKGRDNWWMAFSWTLSVLIIAGLVRLAYAAAVAKLPIPGLA